MWTTGYIDKIKLLFLGSLCRSSLFINILFSYLTQGCHVALGYVPDIINILKAYNLYSYLDHYLKDCTFLKAMQLHEAICPCNLQCNFCRKKYCRCQTYPTCFATCNEIIFYARQVFKNVSGILIISYCDWFLLKRIASQVAVGMSHAATCRVALRKVETTSTFSATCNATFHCETSCKHGMSHEEVFLAT